MDFKKWAEENTIHRIVAGSRLYGTATELSDIDIRGVCLMPAEALLGLQRFDQYQDTKSDTVIYGLTKFFNLCLGANPNILDILCAPPGRWLIESDQWVRIYARQDIFLSQKVRHTFSGYAYSQLARIKRHREWLVNPPSHQPTLEEFGGTLESDTKGGQKKVFPHLDAENKYNSAARHWKQYQTWLKERNPARAELERLYGYDTKHAAHLGRLLIKAIRILKDGRYSPVLEGEWELEFVLNILHGKMEYEELVRWAADMERRVSSVESVLPRTPNFNEAEKLLMQINKEAL